jgi:hypothetical protein
MKEEEKTMTGKQHQLMADLLTLIDQAADRLSSLEQSYSANTPERKMFGAYMEEIYKIKWDIELGPGSQDLNTSLNQLLQSVTENKDKWQDPFQYQRVAGLLNWVLYHDINDSEWKQAIEAMLDMDVEVYVKAERVVSVIHLWKQSTQNSTDK